MMQAANLVVVSFYDRRPTGPLVDLLQSLDQHPAGAEFDLLLVVNSTGEWRVPEALLAPGMRVLYRRNAGMNIGAWHGAWQHATDYSRYLFLQDECLAVAEGWLSAFVAGLDDPAVGLLGESYNQNWDKPWDNLRQGPGATVMPEHDIDGRPANRVDVYLDFMRRQGIDTGSRGGHLRSLAWALRGDTLRRIGGFPEGGNYGECIAAEIGVSKAVEALGLRVSQVAARPFAYFRHVEWNQDQPGGPFTHKPVFRRRQEELEAELAALRVRLDAMPTWAEWRALTWQLLRHAIGAGRKI